MADKSTAQAASMIPVSSVFIPDDIPNRADGWEKKLNELIASIKANGQIQPIVVAIMPNEGPNGEIYELIAGLRRIAALKALSHTTVKAVTIPSKASKKVKFGTRVAENFGRMNYSPMEEARCVEFGLKELKMTQKDVAEIMGKSAGWVSQRVAALEQPPDAQSALEKGNITFTHVRALARVKDEDAKDKLLGYACKEDAVTFEERVETTLSGKKPAKKAKRTAKLETPVANRKVRDEKEVTKMIKDVTKAVNKAAKEENKNKEAHLKGIVKGIAWSNKLKGVSIRL